MLSVGLQLGLAAFSATGSHFTHVWHVTRSEFDQLLLDNARKLGATVHEAAQVTEIPRDETGRVTGVAYTQDGEPRRATGRFVVDASGQGRVLTRQMTANLAQEDLRAR
nr:FAD-dependent oxidoreductase [Streptomyces sp. 6-11-2]